MRVLIGLGGNIGSPPEAFRRALTAFDEHGVRVQRLSKLYRSRPVGPDQPEFWNQAAVVSTNDNLLALLDTCQQLERAAGRDREREVRWGPRRIDLDLLMAENAVHRGPRLTLPHPLFQTRSFALVPAADIVPDWRHPIVGMRIAELARQVCEADPEAVWTAGER